MEQKLNDSDANENAMFSMSFQFGEEISRGAEAVLYRRGDSVIKFRHKKGYRISEIDSELRTSRTRREVRIMRKVSKLGIPSPRIISEDEQQCFFEMEFIEGEKLRDILKKDNYLEFCTQLGRIIAGLHSADIIHNDLTTSNMIIRSGKLHIIDFGLSFHSKRVEDKAVDLHLLRQALESKHQELWEEAYSAVLESYKKHYSDAESVLKRLEVVEGRGRYKKKGGRR
ncbi:MAG: KEOPS complex kinase/ATPase Bud32 [Candidatus Woesearchaeota archaeon]